MPETNTRLPTYVINHVQSLLANNFLSYENKFVTCIISSCKIDTSTPYSLEIIDLIDPENNHFLVLANSLDTLLKIVPLDLTCFSVVPYVSDCEECKKFVENFMAQAMNKEKKEHAC